MALPSRWTEADQQPQQQQQQRDAFQNQIPSDEETLRAILEWDHPGVPIVADWDAIDGLPPFSQKEKVIGAFNALVLLNATKSYLWKEWEPCKFVQECRRGRRLISGEAFAAGFMTAVRRYAGTRGAEEAEWREAMLDAMTEAYRYGINYRLGLLLFTLSFRFSEKEDEAAHAAQLHATQYAHIFAKGYEAACRGLLGLGDGGGRTVPSPKQLLQKYRSGEGN